MSIKIQGGTSKGTNKCDTCRYFRRVDYQNGISHLECAGMGGNENLRLTGQVAECNIFVDKGVEDLWSLKEKAWIIEISKSKKIGFISPLNRSERQNKELENLE